MQAFAPSATSARTWPEQMVPDPPVQKTALLAGKLVSPRSANITGVQSIAPECTWRGTLIFGLRGQNLPNMPSFQDELTKQPLEEVIMKICAQETRRESVQVDFHNELIRRRIRRRYVTYVQSKYGRDKEVQAALALTGRKTRQFSCRPYGNSA